MPNTGIQYELFVQRVQQAIIDSEQYAEQKNIKVEHNKTLTDRCGIDRQFDLYWEYELGGFTYKNIIECKDFENAIPIEKVDALLGKMHDLPGIKPIIATRNGYQSGAMQKAIENNIDIIVVRDEDATKDWCDENGEPIIRSITLRLVGMRGLTVLGATFMLDKEWLLANGLNLTDGAKFDFRSDEALLHFSNGSTLNIQDYLRTKHPEGDICGETYTYEEYFDDVFVSSPHHDHVKLKGIKITYTIPPPLESEIQIAPEVLGVVEYLNQHTKRIVFKRNM